MSSISDDGIYESTEIGWEGPLDELGLFLLVQSFACVSASESVPILDPKVKKIGLSFRSNRKYKSVL